MTQIHGFGYGESHNWIRGQTFVADRPEDKGTVYTCPCGASFVHRYDLIPDIWKAIKESGVTEICPLSK